MSNFDIIEIRECNQCRGRIATCLPSSTSFDLCYACLGHGSSIDDIVNQWLAEAEMEVMNEDQLCRLIDQGSIEALKYLSRLKAP